MLTDERVDPEISTDYLSQRIFFCCQKCSKQFRASPASYLSNLPTNFLHGEKASPPHQESAQSDHSGKGNAHAQGHTDEEPLAANHQHDHADHGESSAHGVVAWLKWLGRLHPMLVHFPIALLLLATLAELLAIRTRDARFSFAARFSLWVGTIGAMVAAPLGWADALGVAKDYAGTPATLLFYHRWAGTSTAGVALLALVLCERFYRNSQQGSQRLYRIVLFFSAFLVTVTGHLGASLIFGHDYLIR